MLLTFNYQFIQVKKKFFFLVHTTIVTYNTKLHHNFDIIIARNITKFHLFITSFFFSSIFNIKDKYFMQKNYFFAEKIVYYAKKMYCVQKTSFFLHVILFFRLETGECLWLKPLYVQKSSFLYWKLVIFCCCKKLFICKFVSFI